MEDLKRERTQYRRMFTKACNEFERVSKDLGLDERVEKLQVIEEKAKLMLTCEESCKKHVFEETDETKLEKELDEMEAYFDRARVFKKKLEKLTLEQVSKTNPVLDEYAPVSGQSQNALRYPTIKLPTFDGDVRNYLNFWGQFEKVDKDPNLDLHDKFAYLAQTMKEGSPADELLKSFPPGGQSYEKALNQLKARFGREELLIQVYVRDLLSLVLQRQNVAKFSLRKLYDSLVSKLRSLELLGVTSEKYAAMLFPLVESSLPEEILIAWERYRAVNRRVLEDSVPSQGEKSELECILEFLQSEVEAEERIELASCSLTQHKSREPGRGYSRATYNPERERGRQSDRVKELPSATDLFTASQVPKKCIFCSLPHPSADCLKARKMKLKEREELVQQSRSCFLCLKPNHSVKKCFMKTSCLCCGKKHNILLCRSMQWKTELTEKNSVSENKPVVVSAEKDQVLASFCSKPSVALQTLKVIIRGNGKRRTARAIIDSGSQRSYLLRDTAEEMAYQPEGFEFLQHSLFGGKNTDVCKHDVFTLYLSSVDDAYHCNFKVLSQPVICESVPPLVDKTILQEFARCGVVPVNDCQGPIEVLIGADVAGKLLTAGHKLLPCGLAAVHTRLGWTVMGRVPQSSMDGSASLVVTSMLSRVVSVADLWSLDILGISDPSAKKSQLQLQEATKEHFLSTVEVREDRFVVHLPWLEDHAALPDNYELALKRLETTVRRLKTDFLYEDYETVLKGWCNDGIIEEVTSCEQVPVHYLPHRAVVKENSTTRIRPVFDASAKVKGFPSLNDCLEKGPNMIELIPNILLRFREKEIGVISDISKAFLQISVTPSDRDFLRFLWRDSCGELKTYRHCRVVFGVSCSPFLLASTIQLTLHDVLNKIACGESHYQRETIEKLLLSFYVDNCVTSVADREELDHFMRVSTEVMASRKFLLRGWEHTNPKTESPVDSNVLGITWDRKSDTLRVNTTGLKELCFDKVTKRTILSAAHRVFDPIGITCPVTLIPKLLLQKLWKMNLSWDDEVDLETKKDFLKWVADSVFLNSICIPRYFGGNNVENCTIHFFCDASKQAYAVVAFVRIETPGAVRVRLLQARSRVAPTGKEETTITRLELLAATIASRLSSNILPEMSCDASYFWTDSTTVLAWITRREQWSAFVQNRVKEIRELTDAKSWRHVPGSVNPADLPSRGCSAQHLFKLRWHEGPSWLYLPKEEWPWAEVVANESEVFKERKKGVASSSCLVASTTSRDWYYSYFSRYGQIVNLIAWILRFVHNCRSPKSEKERGCLKPEEISEAERRIVKMIQEDSFMCEEEKLKTLKTFKDEKNIIRLKTKLIFREDTEEFRSPAVLPSEHEVVKRLIFHYHVKMQHAGTQMLLNLLREKYWIINGRRAVRSIVRKCIKCRRFSAKNLDTSSAPLPENRVKDAAVFEICGIDMAGPLYLRDEKKAWICIFTCAIYRAVHFELVTSLSTESFLLALRRFVARRGRCKVIYCDNGTNFVGAARLLKNLDWNKITADTSLFPIQWKFNPPTAAWWGGFWERLIGVLKKLLKSVLGRASLSYEELVTIICDCESIVNSRPLTYVSENESELIPLSPNLFFQDLKTSGVPDIEEVDHQSLNKRLIYRRNLQSDLRKRFRSEYLGALIQRSERKRISSVSVGDVVLIGSDNTKRINWPLGRVVEVLPGKEGIVRLVRLQTSTGQMLRPIQRLFPLEITSEFGENIRGKMKVVKDHSKVFRAPIVGDVNSIPRTVTTRYGRVIQTPKRLGL